MVPIYSFFLGTEAEIWNRDQNIKKNHLHTFFAAKNMQIFYLVKCIYHIISTNYLLLTRLHNTYKKL